MSVNTHIQRGVRLLIDFQGSSGPKKGTANLPGRENSKNLASSAYLCARFGSA
jgi:hypothetical protein